MSSALGRASPPEPVWRDLERARAVIWRPVWTGTRSVWVGIRVDDLQSAHHDPVDPCIPKLHGDDGTPLDIRIDVTAPLRVLRAWVCLPFRSGRCTVRFKSVAVITLQALPRCHGFPSMSMRRMLCTLRNRQTFPSALPR